MKIEWLSHKWFVGACEQLADNLISFSVNVAECYIEISEESELDFDIKDLGGIEGIDFNKLNFQ